VHMRRRVVDGAREDGAAAGVVDAHQLLHHLGGGGDLGAAHRAIDRLRQPVIGLLRGVGLAQRRGFQFVRQIAIGQAAGARVPHPLGHGVDAVAGVHGGNCSADRARRNRGYDA
jgi:hypothetical protein